MRSLSPNLLLICNHCREKKKERESDSAGKRERERERERESKRQGGGDLVENTIGTCKERKERFTKENAFRSTLKQGTCHDKKSTPYGTCQFFFLCKTGKLKAADTFKTRPSLVLQQIADMKGVARQNGSPGILQLMCLVVVNTFSLCSW